MGNIHKLSDNLINLIAAGEVVERPASVLKELLENSLDAKSTKIIVRLTNGGIDKITIQDNGVGMDTSDALLAFTQHATSKIAEERDLQNIHTLGFRGEALASISSVSEIELDTKQEESEGTKIKAAESAIQHLSTSKSTIGTTVTVTGLFNNLPARKKFLKSANTEFRHIQNLFQAVVLTHPQVHFELHNNEKTIHRLPAVESMVTRVHDLWGATISQNLYSIESEHSGSTIKAFLGKPDIARQDRKRQFVFVNNRPVSDRIVQRAIADAYKGFIHRDQQPVYFIFLTIPPEEVDVNVHPRKLEVRFANTSNVYRLVYTSLRSKLEGSTKEDLLKRVQSSPERSTGNSESAMQNLRDFSKKAIASQSGSAPSRSLTPKHNAGTVRESLSFTKQLLSTPTTRIEEREEYQYFNPIQLFNTYIVYENDDSIIFIDQHAAAESIMYEKILSETNVSRTKQKLVPEVLEFTTEEKSLLMEKLTGLKEIGIGITDFGGNSIQITSTPEALSSFDTKGFLQEMLEEELSLEPETIGKLGLDIKTNLETHNPQLHTLVATLACHGSVRAGQPLSKTEMIQIIRDLSKGSNTYNCPHGRPVSWVLEKQQLEKNFSRIL